MLSEGRGLHPLDPCIWNPKNERMAQTSIHVQAVKGGSEQHNKREKTLDYIRPDLSHMNDYWQSSTQAARLESIKSRYLKSTGQKMQAKATPIREGVVVIKADTTMEDLKKLSEAYRRRFGMEVFQIAIHKDEGYPNAERWTPNLHAHLVFDWTDQNTGKSLKLNRQDMVDMQTITAEVLRMERGVSSNKEHLSAIQYKNLAEQERIRKLQKEKRAIEQELEQLKAGRVRKEMTIEAIKNLSEGIKGVFGENSKDKIIKSLRREINALNEKVDTLQKQKNNIPQIIEKEVREGIEKARKEEKNNYHNLYAVATKNTGINGVYSFQKVYDAVEELRKDFESYQQLYAKSCQDNRRLREAYLEIRDKKEPEEEQTKKRGMGL